MLTQVLTRALSSVVPTTLHPYHLARRVIHRACNGRILCGPFASMRYSKASICSAFEPKLLGIYELELWPVIESLCKQGFLTIVDVGAAEGYYAVGMAARCPRAQVIAFESSKEGQEMIAEMAGVNGVAERVDVRGHCTVEDLANVLCSSTGTLIIMDVEGAEESLLSLERIPELAESSMLIETHDFAFEGVTSRLRSQFKRTHEIQELNARERTLDDLPVRSWLLDRWLLKYTREFRPPEMKWLSMSPRG